MLSSGFEHLHITVTKAQIVVMDGQRMATYTVSVLNKQTRTLVTTTRTDADFKRLQQNVCISLDHGHTCDALCPWFYVDVQQKVPKKPWFRSMTNVRVVESHLRAYQSLIDVLVAFVSSPHNRSCFRATERVPDAFLEFLFEVNTSQARDMAILPPSSKQHRLSNSSIISTDSEGGFDCSLCHGASESHGLTSMGCGHVFHDECILEALNHHLECPVCHHH